MCKSALQSSPASASMNYHHCFKGGKLFLRKTCLSTCMNEEITLTSYDVCSKHYRRTDPLSWCRRGYESTFESIKLLLGAQDQEDVTSIHDESINVITLMEDESSIEDESLTIETIIESEEVPKNESVSLVLDHSAESSSSTSEEEKTILHFSIFNKTDDSTPSLTNSSDNHIDQSLIPLYVFDQYFTQTVPCLYDEMNMSIVKDDASFDVSLDKPDSKELLPAISHDIIDALSIVCIILTSITAVFFASIIIWLSAVHCWALLVGIISCLISTRFLGRASDTTTTRSIDTLYKRVFILMISFLRRGLNTSTNLIRILLLSIDSLLNIPRWIWHTYGPGSHGRSVFDIMFNSNPKQGPKQCKVASTFNAIVQGLLDTGQASLLKLILLPFALARLVQVLAIISYVLILSVAKSISEDVGICLHITRDAFVGMIRPIRVSIAKSYVFVHSTVEPFLEATRDCLYHVQASIFGMARLARNTGIKSYTYTQTAVASISMTVGNFLYHVQSSLDGMARRTHIFAAVSYSIILSVVETISKAAHGCIHSIQASIFGTARRIQVSIIISYVLARSVAVSILNDVGSCLYHILLPLSGILLVPYWYWKEFGPYSQGRSVFDILFRSNPQHRRRLKRGGQVASSRLNNIETYTYHQYLPWHIYKQFDPGITSNYSPCPFMYYNGQRAPLGILTVYTSILSGSILSYPWLSYLGYSTVPCWKVNEQVPHYYYLGNNQMYHHHRHDS